MVIEGARTILTILFYYVLKEVKKEVKTKKTKKLTKWLILFSLPHYPDVQYPENLHELHNDLPFLPERIKTRKVE